jgi:hypothetical protein
LEPLSTTPLSTLAVKTRTIVFDPTSANHATQTQTSTSSANHPIGSLRHLHDDRKRPNFRRILCLWICQ